ncbi:unnamed protein product, partial [Ectocarpus sp. 12 AP-2014]
TQSLNEEQRKLLDDPWMDSSHRAGLKHSPFTGHSEVHFVSAHVEHDGQGGVRANSGYMLGDTDEGRLAASTTASAASETAAATTNP